MFILYYYVVILCLGWFCTTSWLQAVLPQYDVSDYNPAAVMPYRYGQMNGEYRR